MATGVWNKDKLISQNKDYLPSNVDWVQEMAKAIDPVSMTVTTDTGRSLRWDFLVVATGVEYHYSVVEGFSLEAVGSNGLTAVYSSPTHAEKNRGAIDRLNQLGGQDRAKVAFIGGQLGVFSVPVINEIGLKRFAAEGLEVQKETVLAQVNISSRVATLKGQGRN